MHICIMYVYKEYNFNPPLQGYYNNVYYVCTCI